MLNMNVIRWAMMGIEKYLEKDMLLETIKFNTRFLEMLVGDKNIDCDSELQCLELNSLLSEWQLRHYDSNCEIELATSLLEMFHLV